MAKEKFNSRYKGFSKDYQKQFNNLRNSYYMTLSLVSMYYDKTSLNALNDKHFLCKADGGFVFVNGDLKKLLYEEMMNFHISFNQICDSFQKYDEQKKFNMIKDYLNFCLPNLFISLYESFKQDETRYNKVKNLDWFMFIANLRHSMAHGVDGIWSINTFGKDEISFVRKDKIKITLNKNLDGQQIDLNKHIGGFFTILNLINTVDEFVESNTQSRSDKKRSQVFSINHKATQALT